MPRERLVVMPTSPVPPHSAGDFDAALGGCDAAVDSSVAACFTELDAAYPGSYFVLTTRVDKQVRHPAEGASTCRGARDAAYWAPPFCVRRPGCGPCTAILPWPASVVHVRRAARVAT